MWRAYKQNFTCRYVSCIFVLLSVHTMETCRESEVQLHSFTTRGLDVGMLWASHPNNAAKSSHGAPEPIWTIWERKNVMLSLSGIEPQFLDLTFRNFTTPTFILFCTHGWTMLWRHYSVPVTCPAKLQTLFEARSRNCRVVLSDVEGQLKSKNVYRQQTGF